MEVCMFCSEKPDYQPEDGKEILCSSCVQRILSTPHERLEELYLKCIGYAENPPSPKYDEETQTWIDKVNRRGFVLPGRPKELGLNYARKARALKMFIQEDRENEKHEETRFVRTDRKDRPARTDEGGRTVRPVRDNTPST